MRILALDLGTSSARAMVVNEKGTPVPAAYARRKVSVAATADGAGTLDGPDYLAVVVECLDELAGDGRLDDIDLVAVSAQWHSVLAVDRAGRPLTPVLTWLDTRPEPPAHALRPADERDFHRRTGTWLHRSYWTARLPWLRARLDPAPSRYLGLVEYILGVLLDEAPMSASQASGTGLLDLRTLTWDPQALQIAGVRTDALPPLAPPGWRGRLRPEYVRRWPALRGVQWTEPVGDGAAANVGSGCTGPDRIALTVGTSAAVRLIQPAPTGTQLPPLPERLWRYRVDRNHVVTGVSYSCGGNLFAWAKRVLRLPEGPELAAALSAISISRTIWTDPRLGGDRPPNTTPAGSGRIHGVGFETTSVDILAGLMGALCRQVAHDIPEIEAMVDGQLPVTMGGGAISASAWWRQAFANTLAPRPVRHEPNPEIGVTGAALVALGRLGMTFGIGRTDEGLSVTPPISVPPPYSS